MENLRLILGIVAVFLGAISLTISLQLLFQLRRTRRLYVPSARTLEKRRRALEKEEERNPR